MNKFISLMFFVLVSHVAQADSVASIAIFQSEFSAVTKDLNTVNKHIPIKVYRIDAMDVTEKVINDKLKERVGSFKAATPMESYSNAFFDLLNSSEWPEIAKGFEAGAESIEYAIRYKIKKLPAIVFNDRDVIYGVNSLSQAMIIFNQSQGSK